MVQLVQRVDPELIKRLAQIEADNFGVGGLNEWTLVPMIRHGKVFTISKDNIIAGLVQYMLDWDEPEKAYLIGVSICKDLRGQGLGTRLLRESFSYLRNNGILEVELTVDPDNTGAFNLYKNVLDFHVTEYRENEYGVGENRLVMCRFL